MSKEKLIEEFKKEFQPKGTKPEKNDSYGNYDDTFYDGYDAAIYDVYEFLKDKSTT